MENQKIARFKVVNTFPRPAGINQGRGLVFERNLDLSHLEELKESFENLEPNKQIRHKLDLTNRYDFIWVNIQDITRNKEESWDIEVKIPSYEINKFRKLMEENEFAFGPDDDPKYEIIEK